ncbi:nuclear transport factor 2 family protein [Nocardia carnea]|uniref:nuclear transport factor 2 family protein n=1 Tax=Nocardia carnea TaxID=37328 RepID=UPI0024575F22|nr:nuclear transport factor 2 family protein [Nocardia carnea]
MTESPRSPGRTGDIDIAAEIERVHDLLAAWLGSAASPRVLDAFAAAHDEDFSMVTTAGTVIRKRELLSGLHRARNGRPGLVIEISEVETLCATGDTAVVRFVECQRGSGEPEYRRTTAALRTDSGQSFQWLALQETAVAEPEGITRSNE